jgi:4-amino-4-deoxy-L-arabinose transferase-like glycosyltransferase
VDSTAPRDPQPLPVRPNHKWRVGPLAVTPVTLVLLVILAVAVAIRVYDIGANPQGFFADEASFGYNAYTIAAHGVDEWGERFPLLFKSFGEYKLPVYTYAIVPFVALLGLTQEAVRLATAALGAATVLAVFFLGRAMFRSTAVGLIAAGFLAVLPWHVHYSRTGLGDIIAYPLFLVLCLTFFYKGRGQPWPWWPLSAASLALAFYSYRGGWVFMPLLIAALLAVYWQEIWKERYLAFISAGIFIVMLLPIAWHLAFGGGDRIQQVPILSNEARGGKTLFEAYFNYFSPWFLFINGDDGFILRHYLPGHGNMYWVQAPLLLLGLGALLLQRTREGILLFFGFFLYPWSGALTDTGAISSRTIIGAVLYSLLTGIGFAAALSLLDRVRGNAGRLAGAVFAGMVVFISIYQVGGYLQHYHNSYPALSAGYWGWQWGPEEIVPYFASMEDQYDRLYLDGEFNAPYIFFRFYAPDACRKCEIGNLDSYDPTLKQLFALRPNNLLERHSYDTKRTLFYPDGTVAFFIVEVVPS